MNAYVDKVIEPAIAAGMGAGLAAVLLPDTSLTIGAIAGLAKYFFDGLYGHSVRKDLQPYQIHARSPFLANAIFKTLPFVLIMKVSHYIANSRFFNSKSLSGLNNKFLSNYAFALLISKKT